MDRRISLPPFSMWSQTPVYDVGGSIVHGLMVPPIIADPTDDIYEVPVNGQRRLDLLSSLHYGTPHLWWVVATVNGIMDPMAGIQHGSLIRIPRKTRLAQLGLLNI